MSEQQSLPSSVGTVTTSTTSQKQPTAADLAESIRLLKKLRSSTESSPSQSRKEHTTVPTDGQIQSYRHRERDQVIDWLNKRAGKLEETSEDLKEHNIIALGDELYLTAQLYRAIGNDLKQGKHVEV